MKYILMADMTCVEDISSCCSDYGIAYYLFIIKKVLDIIHIVVPMILIIMITIDFVKMVLNPDDPQKKKSKSLFNKFFSAIFIFFVPFVINLLFNLIDGFGVEISGCWKAAEEIVNQMENTEEYNSDTGENSSSSNYASNSAGSNKVNSNDSNKTKGEKIVNYALRFVGNPYVYGGNSLTNGCDCSHFVYLVLKNVGVYNGEYAVANAWANKGKPVSGGLKNAQAGDVIVYNGHIGIYDGKKYLIEAKGTKYGITHDRKPEQCSKTLLAVRRFT